MPAASKPTLPQAHAARTWARALSDDALTIHLRFLADGIAGGEAKHSRAKSEALLREAAARLASATARRAR